MHQARYLFIYLFIYLKSKHMGVREVGAGMHGRALGWMSRKLAGEGAARTTAGHGVLGGGMG